MAPSPDSTAIEVRCGSRCFCGERLVVDAETSEIVHTEEAEQLATAAVGIEQPWRAAPHAVAGLDEARPAFFVGNESLGRFQPREFGFQCVFAGDLVHQQAARGEVRPGDAETLLAARDRQQQGVATLVEQGLVGDGARRDDADDLAFDQSLRLRRVADLLADGDRLAECDEAREVALAGVVRHACHRNWLPRGISALGQGDVEQARGLAGVVVEQLVEVAHAEEQQHVRMLRLGGEELLHERGVFGGGACGRAVHEGIAVHRFRRSGRCAMHNMMTAGGPGCRLAQRGRADSTHSPRRL